ncbi:MAG: class I SAM-dependent methyltransferase [Betaproteobacteria bacterium]
MSPVRYDFSSVDAHLQRRASLYRALGVLPLAIQGSSVLEVAAGSGQNSLYVATLRPRCLTLLEPNRTGISDIETLYANQPLPHTHPAVVCAKLEDFQPDERFDLVICENWLGCSFHERSLLRKLGTMVAPGGVLVVTAVSPIGFLPNVIRRGIAARLCIGEDSFDRQTEMLVRAFGPHLQTMPSMTRSAIDWVHDNMLNPAYFELSLPISTVIDELGADFDIIGSSPHFAQDWRWFKSLHGDSRRFNEHFLDEYFANCHSLLDHRSVRPRGDGAANRALEHAAFHTIEAVREYEAAFRNPIEDADAIAHALWHRLGTALAEARATVSRETVDALEQGIDVLQRPNLDVEAVATADAFAGLFGRETLYVSFERAITRGATPGEAQ